MTKAIGQNFDAPTVSLETPKTPSNMKIVAKQLAMVFAGIIEGALVVATPVLAHALFGRVAAFFNPELDKFDHVKGEVIERDQSSLSVAIRSYILPAAIIAGFVTMYRRAMPNFFSPERKQVMQGEISLALGREFDRVQFDPERKQEIQGEISALGLEFDRVQFDEAKQKAEIKEMRGIGQIVGANSVAMVYFWPQRPQSTLL